MSEQQSKREPWKNLGDPLLNNRTTYIVTIEEKGTQVQWLKHCVNCISLSEALTKYSGQVLRDLSSICTEHYLQLNPPKGGS